MTTILQRVLDGLTNVAPSGSGYSALCPAHEDTHSSLSVAEGTNGRVLLNCHKGCAASSVASALGLSMADLSHETPTSELTASRIAAAYPYVDARGTLLFETVRLEPKAFRQRRPLGDGKWTWAIGDVERPLYNLPEVNAAIELGQRIYVVEGEKDVETLRRVGLVGTTNPFGAGKWRDEHAEALSGASVVIIPDNDPVGREHAATVYEALQNRAHAVRILELPDLREKGDVSDWLGNGHTAEDLETLAGAPPTSSAASVTAARQVEPSAPPALQPRFQLLGESELGSLPKRKYLVQSLIPEHCVALGFGARQSLKSFAAVDIGLCIAAGLPWHGLAVQQGPVVFIAAEGRSGLHLRIDAWKQYHGVTQAVDVSFILEPVQLMVRKEVDALLNCLRRRERLPVLIIIDTLHRCLAGGDENSSRDVGIAIAAVDRLRKELSSAVFLMHHIRRASQHERGSTALGDSADVTLFFERHGDRLTIKNLKQKDGEEHPPMRLRLLRHGESCVLTADKGKAAATIELTPNQRAMLDCLRDGGLSHAEWLQAARLAKSTFERGRERLTDIGLVEKVEAHNGDVYRRSTVEDKKT